MEHASNHWPMHVNFDAEGVHPDEGAVTTIVAKIQKVASRCNELGHIMIWKSKATCQ